MNSYKTAIKLYNLLKAEYNTLILITFNILYRKIFRCFLISHKSLREYFDDVVRVKNKLRELDDLISKMIVISCFLNELNSLYNDWENVYMIINRLIAGLDFGHVEQSDSIQISSRTIFFVRRIELNLISCSTFELDSYKLFEILN